MDNYTKFATFFYTIIIGWIFAGFFYYLGFIYHLLGCRKTIGRNLYVIASYVFFPYNKLLSRTEHDYSLPSYAQIIWIPGMLYSMFITAYVTFASFLLVICFPVGLQFLDNIFPFIFNPNKVKIINTLTIKYRDMPPP